MTPREIADLFAQMELRLVRSLKRNLSAHKAEERRRGIQWPAWQAEKLRGIRKYREDNRSIVSGYADVIDRETEQMLEEGMPPDRRRSTGTRPPPAWMRRKNPPAFLGSTGKRSTV